MSQIWIGLIATGAVLLLLLLRMPIGFALALVGFLGYSFVAGTGPALASLGVSVFSTSAGYVITTIPLFLLLGEFGFHSGMTVDMYKAAYKWLGHLPGGLAITTIGASAGLSAVSGTSLGTAAAMAPVALPEMKRYNYDVKLATGSVAAGGALGNIIPPGVAFVIYGLITEQSVAKLLIAGIFPGLLLALAFGLTIYIITRINPRLGPPGPKVAWKERLLSLKDVWGVLVIFLLIMGGIYGGIFTASEAAAVGAFGTFLLALGRRKLTRKNLASSLKATTSMTAMIMVIVTGAAIFGYFLTVSLIPMKLADFIVALPLSRYGILVVIFLLYILLGMMVDAMSMMLLTLPIVYPVVLALGFDPIWFGVTIVILVEIAVLTPPVGMNVYVVAAAAGDVRVEDVFRGIMPFFLAELITLAILVAFPQISLFLPSLMSR